MLASVDTSSNYAEVTRNHKETLSFIIENNVTLIYTTDANYYQEDNDIPNLHVTAYDYHQLSHFILTSEQAH